VCVSLSLPVQSPSAAHNLPPQLGGWCKITSLVGGPGLIRHVGLNPPIQGTGLLRGTGPWAASELGRMAAAFAAAPGLRLAVEADPLLPMWRKLAGMAAYSTVCAVARCPIGPVVANPASKATLRQARDAPPSSGSALTQKKESRAPQPGWARPG
jgi:ketopantoate reductase